MTVELTKAEEKEVILAKLKGVAKSMVSLKLDLKIATEIEENDEQGDKIRKEIKRVLRIQEMLEKELGKE